MHKTCVIVLWNFIMTINVDDSRARDTVLLIIKSYIMKCKFELVCAFSCVALARWFICKGG